MNTVSKPLLPGVTLGVMGGGQLGRMFVHAAQAMGFRTAVLDPDIASPAGLVSHLHIRAGYEDTGGLKQLAEAAQAITTEFENVPAESLRVLAQHRPVAPSGDAVAICQDRADEKAHFARSGVPCAPHAVIQTAEDLAALGHDLLPGILKTARMGYDGKGQVRVATHDALVQAWADLKQVPCVLEKQLPLLLELSVIGARGYDGQWVHYPVQQNTHRDGILAVTEVPAPSVDEALSEQAVQCARAIAESMNYVGVLCVEFFVLDDGHGGRQLVANEMAPRPHNSGHYTIDACDVSQFELQVRAMTGLPLVQPRLHSPTVMLNLLGDLWFVHGDQEATPAWDQVLALPGAHLHLYGKTQAKPGRKMGHLTLTAQTEAQARDTALQAASILGMKAF